ncbi:unnamed protein product [Medioppia subpectinata]|uniref:Uncharacterized protein n=1 Tax=Medioppia subpectinata TaxID=1979941 RepID=A0A7R9KVA8_9ACAR|nr:unnamed protein product [Medioppia subpectinata]CAG2110387.1 unnamed protein product [Medioppia subpectinata]
MRWQSINEMIESSGHKNSFSSMECHSCRRLCVWCELCGHSIQR